MPAKKKSTKKTAKKNKMSAKAKKLWVESLESGKFKQCQGTLAEKNSDGKSYSYCCLGVLTHLHAKHVLGKTLNQAFLDGDYHSPVDNETLTLSSATTLPKEVVKWSGLENDNPDTCFQPNTDEEDYVSEDVSCAGLNDDHELSFKEIAGVVRKSF